MACIIEVTKIIDKNIQNKAGEYLLSLINDLLDLSKLNSGKMQLLNEEIDISLLLHDLVAISGPLIKKKNNQLLTEHDGTEFVYADEMKLKQSLLNLISNAAKFTENGSITLSQSRMWIMFYLRLLIQV